MTNNEITKTSGEVSSEKIKAIYPHIVVSGDIDKPYYSIQYYDIEKKTMFDCYASYKLGLVRKWLEEHFEVIEPDIADFINRLQAEKEALIAGLETLQKALAEKVAEYEALKADEEREHQYCKNVCEPKYKAKIADERAKGDICAAVIARQDKEIECYKARIERFEKIETTVNDLWNEIQRLATFKNKRKPTLEELLEYMENLKDEVIKEYVKRLKEQKYQSSDWSHGEHPFVVEESDIDNVLYEMVDDTE